MRAATAAGDDDEAERLHARYIELGTTYAGRLAAGWRSTGLIARVGETIARARLLAPGEPVLALVSGGADSTLLVARPARARAPARDAACRACAAGCRERARRRGLPRARGRSRAAASRGRRARERRAGARGARAGGRRAAADALRAGRAVATGHTRDDRVETILYRLAASPGSAAFGALPAADGGGRVRPLLELSRSEVRAALRAAGVPWREDASNDDRLHARNRVRLDLLPAFRSLHPAAEANLLRTAELAGRGRGRARRARRGPAVPATADSRPPRSAGAPVAVLRAGTAPRRGASRRPAPLPRSA